MTPRSSGHFFLLGLTFFVLKSLLKIARQWRREKFAILTLKPRSHVRILIYLTWAIRKQLIIPVCFLVLEQKTEGSCNYFE